jgi:hypothetical protein
MRQTKQAAK